MDALRRDARRRHVLSLDTAAGGSGGLHSTIPDPRTVEADDDHDDAEEVAAPRPDSLFAGGLRMVAAREHTRVTKAVHVAAQEAEAREEAFQRELEGAFDLTVLVSWLERLTPAQREIIHARNEIMAEGDLPTHHAVGRRLGKSAANVSKQWTRMVGRAGVASVSTPAA